MISVGSFLILHRMFSPEGSLKPALIPFQLQKIRYSLDSFRWAPISSCYIMCSYLEAPRMTALHTLFPRTFMKFDASYMQRPRIGRWSFILSCLKSHSLQGLPHLDDNSCESSESGQFPIKFLCQSFPTLVCYMGSKNLARYLPLGDISGTDKEIPRGLEPLISVFVTI